MNGLNKISHRVFWLLTVIIVALFFHFKFWKSEGLIAWDMSLYYSYLPAVFIYDDLKVETEEFRRAMDGQHFYTYEDEEGNRFVKMTSGLAFLYAPFFLAAHAYASLSEGFTADGFSLPYRFGLMASTAFFTILGLWFLRKALLRFFSDGATAITLITTYIGTNLLFYSLKEPMPHAYNFFLLSLIFYLYFRFIESPNYGKGIFIGLAAGLLILIRPTNIIGLLFPLFLFFTTDARPFSKYAKFIPAILLAAFLAILPQLLYWHYTTGKWVVYSYNQETFFFTDPEIINGLFSYRKGWIIYSPVLIFSFIGFGFLWFKNRLFAIFSIITLFIALWVTFSWWCWWYGGGFGARPMIDFLPLIALGFAAVFEKLNLAPKLLKIPLYTVVFALCFFSVFYAKQYKSSIIHFDGMTKELFWKQFLIDHYIQDYEKYVERPDYEAAMINKEE